jgi:hypothetical protein
MTIRSGAVVALALGLATCAFPAPADVAAIGGSVSGLWTGAVVTLRLTAGEVTEDVTVDGNAAFTFDHALAAGASYVVEVADDGPDHACAVTNGSGRIDGADVELAVECTNLIPHGLAISTPVPFTFDPRVTRYELPVSILQQGFEAVVSGATLTGATVAGQAVTVGQPSPAVPLGQGTTTVPIVVTKDALSQTYELVFDRGATPIVEAAYAQASNAGASDSFGSGVAAWGDYVAIGAPGEDSSTDAGLDNAATDSGAVYIFHRVGSSWAQTQLLKGAAITGQRRFGNAVAMERDVLVIGAQGDGARGADAGASYVFRLDPVSGRWQQEQRLTASDARAGDRFGTAVAVSGDRLVVGATGHDRGAVSGDYGVVYSFTRSGATWSEDGTVSDPTSHAFDSFGAPLALDGDTLAVGDVPRHVRVFRRSGASWIAEAVPPSCVGPSFDLLGDLLAVGQPTDASGNGLPGDDSAPASGAVRVYTRTGTAWSEAAYLKTAPAHAQARLGLGIGLGPNTLVTTAAGRGELQAFHREGASWVAEPAVAVSGPPSTFGGFASGLALSDRGAVIGSLVDDGQGPAGNARGTAWIFR